MHQDWMQLCRPYPILSWDLEISWRFGEIYRAVVAKGQLRGGNDMWIAATALTHGFGVVTNNQKEFRRVEGLVVETF